MLTDASVQCICFPFVVYNVDDVKYFEVAFKIGPEPVDEILFSVCCFIQFTCSLLLW